MNFSRTVWITFHRRGTASSVSVTSSPIFDSLSEPQHAQDVGGGTTTRSRGRCAGNGLRAGLRRVFGIVKAVLGFTGFSLRGLDKVTGEWDLVALAYNCKRLHKLSLTA